jgi:hypothetical protein
MRTVFALIALLYLSVMSMAQGYGGYNCPTGQGWTQEEIVFTIQVGSECCRASARYCHRITSSGPEIMIGAVWVEPLAATT